MEEQILARSGRDEAKTLVSQPLNRAFSHLMSLLDVTTGENRPCSENLRSPWSTLYAELALGSSLAKKSWKLRTKPRKPRKQR
jgi:hypothetical protein